MAGLPADNPVQLVYSEKGPSYQSHHSIGCRPKLVSSSGILVIFVDWLDMYCDVPYMNPDQQIVPPLSFLLTQGFQNFQHNIGFDIC